MRSLSFVSLLVLGSCLPKPPDYTPDDTGSLPVGLSFEPSGTHDFGEVAIGCVAAHEVYLVNNSDTAAEFHGAFLVGADDGLSFLMGDSAPMPWAIQPDEHRLVGELQYAPQRETMEVDLGVLTGDLGEDVEPIELSVQGAPSGERSVEQFTAGVYPADILLTVDRSGSMSDELSAIANSLGDFLEVLNNSGVDYRILATTQIDGCHEAGEIWIDESHSSSAALGLFEDMVSTSPSPKVTSQGLRRAENALSSERIEPGGCNEGFRREGAMLHIIGASNQVDDSPYKKTPLEYLYTQQERVKWPLEVVYHGIGAEQVCGDAQAYDGFLEVATATRGQWVSICDDKWWTQLEGLARAMVERADRSTYILGDVPLETTLSVEVNQEALSMDKWSYEAEANAVVLEEEAVPAHGADVKIAYYPIPEACE